jgi:hypothetical protein
MARDDAARHVDIGHHEPMHLDGPAAPPLMLPGAVDDLCPADRAPGALTGARERRSAIYVSKQLKHAVEATGVCPSTLRLSR